MLLTAAVACAVVLVLAAMFAPSLRTDAYKRQAEPAVAEILDALRREFAQPPRPICRINAEWMYGWPAFVVTIPAGIDQADAADVAVDIRRRFAQLVARHEESLRRSKTTFDPALGLAILGPGNHHPPL